MPSDVWLGALVAFGTVAAVLVIATVGLRADHVRRRQRRHLVCPVSGQEVDCELVQDVRTGQWKSVESCTAFLEPTWIDCERDCARLLNAGLVPDTGVRPGASPTA